MEEELELDEDEELLLDELEDDEVRVANAVGRGGTVGLTLELDDEDEELLLEELDDEKVLVAAAVGRGGIVGLTLELDKELLEELGVLAIDVDGTAVGVVFVATLGSSLFSSTK